MDRELTNQILHLNHREFAIQEVIGRGASCVVYRAVCPDNTEHLLKEYNPRRIAMYREDNGELCLECEDDRDAFEAGLVRFREGHTLQRRLRLDSDLKNSTSNIQEIYSANGTEYIDMTCFSGQSYEKVREKSVYDLMRCMKALTQVVGNYHKAGLLHLDIKPQNIFTIPETCELVMLFDFDSVVTKETAAMGGAHSYSKDWSAPEQRNPLKKRNICEATDIFAVGEIIFWQLMGRNSTAEDHRSFATYTFDHSAPIFENINPKVFSLLNDLLHHTISAPIDQRYQSAAELITKLDAIIKIADPKEPYLKSSALSMQDFFIGRDAEIQEIHDKLSENRILFLSGIGGIGKSELAKHYAEAYRSSYDTIIFAPYVSDVNMLITDDIAIPIFNFQPYPEEKPQEYCVRKLRKLRELCDERTLLIVDNLDSDEDPDVPKLLELGCKLLITTRMDFSDYGLGQFLYIDALQNKTEIRDIFDKYYTKPLSAEEESCVEQIIDLVVGHTMTVELLAKQMMAGRVKPDKMLAKLQEGGIGESGKEKVRSGKDGNFVAQNTHSHIQTLFNLSKLHDNEIYILVNLSLIVSTGIPTVSFCKWCEIASFDDVNCLISSGWIQHSKQNDRIGLHPILAQLFYSKLKQLPHLTTLKIIPFDDNITNHERAMIGIYATEKIVALDVKIDKKLALARYIVHTHSDYEFYHKKSFNLLVNTLNNSLSQIDDCGEILADTLYVLGHFYSERNEETAYDYFLQWYSHKKELPLTPWVSDKYLAVALFFERFGAQEIAKKIYAYIIHGATKYMEYFAKTSVLDEDLIQTLSFVLCNHLVISSIKQENFSVAEQSFSQMKQLFPEANHIKSPEYIMEEHIISAILKVKKSLYKDAIEYFEKAISIQLQISKENHPNTAHLFDAIAAIYLHLGNKAKAESYLKSAINIRKQLFDTEEPIGNAYSYNLMGILRYRQGAIKEACANWKTSISLQFKKAFPTPTVSELMDLLRTNEALYLVDSEESKDQHIKNILSLQYMLNEKKLKKRKIKTFFTFMHMLCSIQKNVESWMSKAETEIRNDLMNKILSRCIFSIVEEI